MTIRDMIHEVELDGDVVIHQQGSSCDGVSMWDLHTKDPLLDQPILSIKCDRPKRSKRGALVPFFYIEVMANDSEGVVV